MELLFLVLLGGAKFGFCADFKVQMNSEDHPRTMVAKKILNPRPKKNLLCSGLITLTFRHRASSI